jgi:hypothetical protein
MKLFIEDKTILHFIRFKRSPAVPVAEFIRIIGLTALNFFTDTEQIIRNSVYTVANIKNYYHAIEN